MYWQGARYSKFELWSDGYEGDRHTPRGVEGEVVDLLLVVGIP
jgi:hypothetical protein